MGLVLKWERLRRDHVQTAELQRLAWGSGFTLGELSRVSGVNVRVLFRVWRCHTRFTTLDTASLILGAIGVSVDELFTAWIVSRDERGRERLSTINRAAGIPARETPPARIPGRTRSRTPPPKRLDGRCKDRAR